MLLCVCMSFSRAGATGEVGFRGFPGLEGERGDQGEIGPKGGVSVFDLFCMIFLP